LPLERSARKQNKHETRKGRQTKKDLWSAQINNSVPVCSDQSLSGWYIINAPGLAQKEERDPSPHIRNRKSRTAAHPYSTLTQVSDVCHIQTSSGHSLEKGTNAGAGIPSGEKNSSNALDLHNEPGNGRGGCAGGFCVGKRTRYLLRIIRDMFRF